MTKLTHGLIGSIALLGLWPAIGSADLALTGYSVTGAMNMPMSSQERIWIRKTTVRRDFVDRGQAYTQLFDLKQRQAAIISHLTRVAQVYDLSAVKAETELMAPAEGLKITLEKTGNSNPLRHWKCEEHALTASMPARLGNEEAIFHLKGKIWLASRVKEMAAVAELIRLANQPGFFLGIPAVAKVSPAQSVAISEIFRKLAPRGLLCAGEAQASYEGNGPLANLATRIPTRISVSFQDFSDAPIKRDVFSYRPAIR